MYENDKKQYIYKLSNGKTINLFYKDNLGIYISYLGRRNVWLEASPLLRDISPGFSADIDSNDNLYILYQDKHGNIIRGCLSDDKLSTKSILSSKNPSINNKNLQVFCMGDNVYYFYVLEYSGSKLLSYQVQSNNGNICTPKVIDYISDSPIPFIIHRSLHNDLYIIYKSSDNKNPYIGYKKYDATKENWSGFKTISSYGSDCNVISSITDSDNSIHLVWQKNHPTKYEIMYSLKKQASEKWEVEKTITSSQYPLYDSSLAVVNNILVFYWIRDNIIYHSNANIGSEFWSGPEKYPFEAKTLYCMQYKSNSSDEIKNRYFTVLPGNFSAGFKLAFINDADLKPGAPTITDVRDLFSDTSKILSKSLDDANQRLKDMKNKIDELEARQLQTEVELSKLGIKISLIDNEVPKYKADNASFPAKSNHNYFWEKQPVNVPLDNSKVDKVLEIKEIPAIIPVVNDIMTETHEYPQQIEDKSKVPVMPGTGFASITPEFLQSLSKK